MSTFLTAKTEIPGADSDFVKFVEDRIKIKIRILKKFEDGKFDLLC